MLKMVIHNQDELKTTWFDTEEVLFAELKTDIPGWIHPESGEVVTDIMELPSYPPDTDLNKVNIKQVFTSRLTCILKSGATIVFESGIADQIAKAIETRTFRAVHINARKSEME